MISIRNLSVDLGDFHLHDLSLEIAGGEFFILMGPTGAGKTILLEAIIGLVPVANGEIFLDGDRITHLPPEKRRIGIVYQDYALFPHLTVGENIAFGRRFQAAAGAQSDELLADLLATLELETLLARYPGTLSGGEQQRVALARALAVGPRVLLLDEPLSALDPRFREELRHYLRLLHRRTGTTFLMVTHDFAEALALAERLAVINRGRLEQVGTPEEIFRQPATTFVAEFVGMKNIFVGRFHGQQFAAGSLEISLGREVELERGCIAIRPEDLVLSTEPLVATSIQNSFAGRVSRIAPTGFHYQVEIQVADLTFTAVITRQSLFSLGLRPGRPVVVSFKAAAVHPLT